MPSLARFPEIGMSRDAVLAQLREFRDSGADWRGGRVPIFVFHADTEVEDISRDAFDLFFSENAQGGSAFPGVDKMLGDLTAAALDLLSAPPEAQALMTSGGTESIFVAVQCARDRARATGRGDTGRHRIVLPFSAHPAFDKAARYLDLKIQRVPLGPDHAADSSALAAALDDDVVMLVGSAPSFPQGIFDPIADLSALAQQSGVWLHVDACVGGYLAPFVRRLGHPVPDFDFSLPGVASISADLHKYGYAAKPASTVLFRSRDLASPAEFRFEAWPRGLYVSRSFQGSRPAGSVASAWAVLHHLGAEGYIRHARVVMDTRDRLIQGIEAIEGLHIQGKPALGLFSYGSDDVDINAVGDALAAGGWFVPRNAQPPGLQFLTMPVHAQAVDRYLADLAQAVESVRSGGRRSATQALY